MKIAYITDVIYPHVKGGAEKRVNELTRRLAGKNEVTVYCMRYWGSEPNTVKDGVRFQGVCRPINLYTRGGRRRIWEALYFSVMLFPKLMLGKFDLIDCSQFPYFPIFTGRIVSWIRRKPLVVTWHEVWCDYWMEYMGALGFFGELVEWLASKLPDRIVAVSEKTKRDLIKLGVPARKIEVIPNGVNIKEVEAANLSNESFDVLYAGRLAPHKNVNLVIEAISPLDCVTALIVGEGPDKKRLVDLASERDVQDRVFFKDFVESDELYGILKTSRVFVLPSSREGFGIGILEANAAGIPAITIRHKNNAAADLIEEGVNGFIADAMPGSITARINEVLCKERDYYIIKCKRKAASFSWDRIFKDTEGVYSKVVGVA